MKKILLLLLLGVTVHISAQHKISGTITSVYNEPLEGVEVYIEELSKGTTSNSIGFFELNNLPSIPIQITIAFLGYESQTFTFSLSKNEILNIKLREAVIKMDEMIISTPFNKLQTENVMKVEKASLKELKATGATTLVEGISSIAGVSQVSTGTGIGKPVIRGLRGNRVLVYNQGIRLENQQFGDEHGLGINESSIESVEAIKGPASLLYGSDALGGVLYFNPLNFADENEFDLKFDQNFQSNTLGSNSSLALKKSYEKWKFLIQGSYNSHSDYKIPNDNRITNTRFNETIFNSAIGYNSSTINSTLRINFNNAEIGIPEELEIQSKSKTPLLPYQDLSNFLVSWKNIFFLENSKITTILGYTSNDRKEFEEHHEHEEEEHNEEEHLEDLEASLHLKLKTYSYDVKWILPSKNNFETIIGIQGMFQDNSNFGEEILIPNAETNDFGGFITTMKEWENHSIQAGIRFDNRNLTTEEHLIQHVDEVHTFKAIHKSFNNFSASLGHKTKLFRLVTTRLNLASGFKAPTLAELTSNGVHHGTNRFEIGNNNLKSERNFQTDLALEYNTKHFEMYVNGFYNYINDYIFVSPTGEIEDEYDVFEYVQDDSKLYGGEIGVHFHPHPLDWLHVYNGFEMVIGKQGNGKNLPLIPAHKLTNTIRSEFNIKDWLKAGFAQVVFETNFKQNKVSMYETPTSAYNLVNLGFGGHIEFKNSDININLNINNVLNKEYYSHLSRLKANGIHNIGRNIILSLSYEL